MENFQFRQSHAQFSVIWAILALPIKIFFIKFFFCVFNPQKIAVLIQFLSMMRALYNSIIETS